MNESVVIRLWESDASTPYVYMVDKSNLEKLIRDTIQRYSSYQQEDDGKVLLYAIKRNSPDVEIVCMDIVDFYRPPLHLTHEEMISKLYSGDTPFIIEDFNE